MTERKSFVKILSRVDLETICLKRLRKCSGFEMVHEVVVQPKNDTQIGLSPGSSPEWKTKIYARRKKLFNRCRRDTDLPTVALSVDRPTLGYQAENRRQVQASISLRICCSLLSVNVNVDGHIGVPTWFRERRQPQQAHSRSMP